MIGIYVGSGYTVCRLIIAFSYNKCYAVFFSSRFAKSHNKRVEYVTIYLFHFFLLSTSLFSVSNTFNTNQNILLLLTVVSIISVIVLFGILLLVKFIKTSKALSFLLLGKKK